MGSSRFAIPSLNAIRESADDLLAVVAMPPAPAGRGRTLTPVPAAVWAKERGVPLIESDKINSPEILSRIEALRPDLIAVCAYGVFLGKRLLSVGQCPPVNIHPSLLPRHRGPAPINWTVIRGDSEAGVSIIHLEREMDAGPILAQRSLKLPPGATAPELEEKLAPMAGEMILGVIREIKEGKSEPKIQDGSLATSNPKLTKDDGRLDFDRPARELARLINGLDPWPGARALYDGMGVKLFSALTEPGEMAPGETREPKKNETRLAVGTGKDLLLVSEFQPEGKKRMSARAFASGYLKPGKTFSRTA